MLGLLQLKIIPNQAEDSRLVAMRREPAIAAGSLLSIEHATSALVLPARRGRHAILPFRRDDSMRTRRVAVCFLCQ